MAERPARVSVRSTRYDGTLRDRFDADLIEASDDMFRVRIHAGTPVEALSGTRLETATATQILFTNRWYNVNHFHQIVPPYRNLWYANLAMPARFDDAEISWVDLDLDVMCDIDRGILIKDEAIFQERADSGYYPPDIVQRVRATCDELLALARAGSFPFDRDTHVSA